jgi:signal transduction histidine kinase
MKVNPAAKVAAATTAAIAVVYVVCVTVFNLVVSAHLSGLADERLAARLSDARVHPAELIQRTRYSPAGADDDGAPIFGWVLDSGRHVTARTSGAPVLSARETAGVRDGQTMTAVLGRSGVFRLKAVRSGTSWLVAGVSLAGDRRTEQLLLISEVIAGPILLLAMFAGALLIGLRSLAPVEQSRRRQLEFTADASHELRTPLSVIRAEADLALAGPRAAADYQDTLSRIRAESDRLRRLVGDMLWLARFDSHPPLPDEGPVDVATLAQVNADRFRSVGPAVTADITGGPALISAPSEWIDRLTGVLLDNACRYAGPGGRVRIGVAATGNRVALTVEDSGPGIPAEQRPQLFDRFSRATEHSSGAGLGLAIGDSIVRSTGGRWEVGDSALGGARLSASWRHARLHRPDGDHRGPAGHEHPAQDQPGASRAFL